MSRRLHDAAFLIEQYAVLRQEHPSPCRNAFEYQIPLSGRDQRRGAAIDANSHFRQRHRLIGTPVGRPLEAALNFQTRHRLAAIVARLDLQRGAPIRSALNMGVDFQLRVLVVGGRDLFLVGQAGAVRAVNLGTGQCLDCEPHHDHVDPDHDAEERGGLKNTCTVNGFGETDDLLISRSSAISSGGDISDQMPPHQSDIGYRDLTGIDFSGLSPEGAVTSSLSSLVDAIANDDHGPIRRNEIDADNMDGGVDGAIDVDRDSDAPCCACSKAEPYRHYELSHRSVLPRPGCGRAIH